MLVRSTNNFCNVLNYIEYLPILITSCVSISVFALLFCILVDIASSEVGLKSYAITSGIKNYKSIINKNKKNKIMLLSKNKLNILDVLISKVLIDSDITHDKFILVNYSSKEYNGMKYKS